MGCRFISMLFLIVLLSLSFVECFPLSEKDRDWYKTMDLIDMRNFGRQIIEDDFVLKQHATTENLNSDISGGTQKVDIEVQNLTKDVLDAYKYKTNSTRLLHRHKRYSMSFQSVHNSLRPYLDPNFDPFYNAHVMPCSYEFRNYCLNNGICAVVRALDIKTCRCPVQYTGKRCEFIDTDYLFSLLGLYRGECFSYISTAPLTPHVVVWMTRVLK